ncbi:transposase domain-containing protein [Rhizobium laguerreae]|uniref:transposase domain-containing protein n=1 Tax=Rhizobium laguerreae TaxID=1076926 RepID=UPI0039181C33
MASLIETAKLNDVEPLIYLSDVLTRIVNGHPNRPAAVGLRRKARTQSRGLRTPRSCS